MITQRILALIVFAVCGLSSQESVTMPTPSKLWDEVVAAKGGRSKLHAIRVLVWSSDQAQVAARSRAIGAERYEFVESFPNKYWSWEDYRPGSMGFSAEVWNAEKRLYWESRNGGPASALPWLASSETARLRNLRRDQLLYLLETAFVAPSPTNVQVDGDYFRLDGRAPGFSAIRYLIDRRTYLVVEISITPEVVTSPGGSPVPGEPTVYRFSGYKKIGEIQMPTRVEGLGEIRFLLNPTLNPALFEQPTDRVTDRDAWRTFLIKTP